MTKDKHYSKEVMRADDNTDDAVTITKIRFRLPEGICRSVSVPVISDFYFARSIDFGDVDKDDENE